MVYPVHWRTAGADIGGVDGYIETVMYIPEMVVKCIEIADANKFINRSLLSVGS